MSRHCKNFNVDTVQSWERFKYFPTSVVHNCVKFDTFTPISVTLIKFQDHSNTGELNVAFSWQLLTYLNSDFVQLLYIYSSMDVMVNMLLVGLTYTYNQGR